VHDVAGVSRAKPSGDLNSEVERFAQGDYSARNFLREGLTFLVLHYNKELLVFGLFDPMDDTDIGMVQPGSGEPF